MAARPRRCAWSSPTSSLPTIDAAKRRWVGSALVVWVCFLPLWVTAGALLIWLTPTVTKVPPEFYSTVRVACALMMGAVLVAGLASLPESVLRGMNLGYKRMGLQAGLSLVGGGLFAAAVYAGRGLVGVAAAGMVLAALTGLCFLGVSCGARSPGSAPSGPAARRSAPCSA